MTVCRDLDEVRAAALADARDDEPMDQDTADLVAAILPHAADRSAA